jgi:threonine dehydrogenase-like Zn-dependent dehydrogenase
MKGIWLEDRSLCFKPNLKIPSIPEGEALVKVRLAGICQTDLELADGYYPFTGIPGHEFVGEIVETPGFPERNGQRVVGEINASCGRCESCRMGLAKHCPHRTVLGIVNRNGAFAEFLTLPLSNLKTLPLGISNEAAVFVEPLAAAFRILEEVHIQPRDRVLLIGAGKLGYLIAQVVRRLGCEFEVLAKHGFQRDLLSRSGIKTSPRRQRESNN